MFSNLFFNTKNLSYEELIKKYKKKYRKGTPLVVACEKGRFEDVKVLITGYNDVNGSNGNNNNMTLKEYVNQVGKRSDGVNENTPLMAAARYEHFQIVKYLIEQFEADPNIARSDGENALHIAAQYNKTTTELIQLLITYMSLDSINKKERGWGRTPLDCAYIYNHSPIRQEIIALIRPKGGKANKHDANGRHVGDGNGDLHDLHNAIKSQNMEVFRKCMNEDETSIAGYMSSDTEKPISRYTIDNLNIDMYKTLAPKIKHIIQNKEDLDINGETNLHYICELKYNKTNEEKHLELTKYIYNTMKPTFRDALDRDRYALVRNNCKWPLVVQWAKSLGAKSLKESLKQTYTTDIGNAEYAIVILTGGILEDKNCLNTLQNILTNRNDLLKNKNIIFIMSKIDGWVFYASKAEKAANNETATKIRKMLNGHEVMSYRPKGENRNYEHDSMMVEMMTRLGVATIGDVSPEQITLMEHQDDVDTEEKVRQGVDDDEQKV